MKPLSVRATFRGAWVGGLLLVPALSFAQTPEEIDSRRALLEEAQAAETRGDRAQALELAERAGRIQMTASVRLFIARNQLAVGRPAQALGSAELCVREATPGTPNREAIVASCTELTTQARTQVGRVIVRPPAQRVPGLVVRVGGSVLNEALLGAPHIVSPGNVLIEAEAPNHTNFREERTVATGETVTIELRLAATQTPPNRRTPNPPPPQGPPIGPIVLMAGGGGLVAVGAIMFGLYASGVNRLQDPARCPVFEMSTNRYTCYQEFSGIKDQAETAGTVGWTLTTVGLGALGGGLAWYFLSRPSAPAPASETQDSRESRVRLLPRIAHDGIGLYGQW